VSAKEASPISIPPSGADSQRPIDVLTERHERALHRQAGENRFLGEVWVVAVTAPFQPPEAARRSR